MKKNLTFAKLVMFVVMAALPLSMMAQDGKKVSKPAEKYWYIQADGGLSIYHGDLANYNGGIWDDFSHFKMIPQNFTKNWNAHLGIGYQFGKVVGLNLKGGYGLLSGHKHNVKSGDPTPQALGFIDGPAGIYSDLGFEGTSYLEGNLNLTFNLFNLFNYNPRRVINLVPHIGIGGIAYKAGAVNQLSVDNTTGTETVGAELKPAMTERKFALAVPAGMEFNFNITPKFDFFLDYTFNFTNTDNLDQVRKQTWSANSSSYVEENRIINNMDMYSQFNLGLRYKFNNPCDIDKMARESKKITYEVNPNPLTADENGQVCFDVITHIPAEYFEKQAVMNLQPYLAYNGGQIDIEPITFVGEKVKGEGDFRVNYKNGGDFTKHYCMPYQPEMENCELMGDPMFYVYNGTIYPTQDEIVKNVYYAQGATEKLADGVLAPKEPEAPVYVDDTIVTNTAVVRLVYFFDKDQSVIKNKKANREADAAFNEILKAGIEKKFEIKGWASPEGELNHNQNLADDRADAANKQMMKLAKKAKVKDIELSGKGYGPDWNTFIELVRNSNLKDKDAIVNNINNSSNKERTIREMIDIYPQLENDILPLIRRAEVVSYEETIQIVKKRVN